MPTMRNAPTTTGETCQDDGQIREANRQSAEQFTAMMNRLVQAANNMSIQQARRNGVTVTGTAAVPQFGSEVTRVVQVALNCGEQRQMEDATQRALQGPVGTSISWTSETRPNVSGSSTVTAADAAGADGSQCMTVTDIVIIDGEETRAPKRMCRVPPATRFVRV